MKQFCRAILALFILGVVSNAFALEELDGPVGIGTGSPLGDLHIQADSNPKLILAEDTRVNYTMLFDDGPANFRFWKINQDGQAIVNFDPLPANGSAALFQYFRSTNTTGVKRLVLYRGNGTNAQDAQIGVDGTTTYFRHPRIGLGTGSPSADYAVHVGTDAETGWAALFTGRINVTGDIDNSGNINTSGNVNVTGETVTSVLEITGGSDLSERFNVAEEPQPGMVVAIDPQNPGSLRVANQPYDRTVAGIVSGAGGVKTGMLMGQQGLDITGKHPVALTGRVYCYVDATEHAVVPGDLLTTSATPGHAMKVADYDRAQGAILGKAMTALGQGEQGLVLVLVSLQ